MHLMLQQISLLRGELLQCGVLRLDGFRHILLRPRNRSMLLLLYPSQGIGARADAKHLCGLAPIVELHLEELLLSLDDPLRCNMLLIVSVHGGGVERLR